MTAIIERHYLAVETLGELVVHNNDQEIFRCKTLELPWKENRRNISCIPEGTYTVKKRRATRTRKYNHFHVLNVPNRNSILIHIGNKVTDILGCILVGARLGDVNQDGVPDVVQSTVTLKAMYEIMPEEFELVIREKEMSGGE
ncbi:DUF5675 family protein [Chryseolinea lacunae]|uniref:DUF5675 domain-containing protein n=1 Tax=Chryseolinea lacunae TaxID=2801331 RepID=A0ABS1KNF9_9BACT|nr:DUF5675 family protein [Chryseolinea lacunae]MBL0740995.1 hypothetical protein [Chryseolinea lacunae]